MSLDGPRGLDGRAHPRTHVGKFGKASKVAQDPKKYPSRSSSVHLLDERTPGFSGGCASGGCASGVAGVKCTCTVVQVLSKHSTSLAPPESRPARAAAVQHVQDVQGAPQSTPDTATRNLMLLVCQAQVPCAHAWCLSVHGTAGVGAGIPFEGHPDAFHNATPTHAPWMRLQPAVASFEGTQRKPARWHAGSGAPGVARAKKTVAISK